MKLLFVIIATITLLISFDSCLSAMSQDYVFVEASYISIINNTVYRTYLTGDIKYDTTSVMTNFEFVIQKNVLASTKSISEEYVANIKGNVKDVGIISLLAAINNSRLVSTTPRAASELRLTIRSSILDSVRFSSDDLRCPEVSSIVNYLDHLLNAADNIIEKTNCRVVDGDFSSPKHLTVDDLCLLGPSLDGKKVRISGRMQDGLLMGYRTTMTACVAYESLFSNHDIGIVSNKDDVVLEGILIQNIKDIGSICDYSIERASIVYELKDAPQANHSR